MIIGPAVLLLGWAALASFAALVIAVRRGLVYRAAGIVLVVSPLAITLLGLVYDSRSLAQSVSLSGNSWAYLFGDTFALSAAFAAATFGWRSLGPGWWTTSWWFVLSFVLGMAAGVTFHIVDGAGYRAVGAGELLGTASKLWHDFVTYPTLFGGLVWVGVPLLFVARNRIATWVCVAGVAAWMVFAVCDNTIHRCDPWKMHGPAAETVQK
jgi:hypothetical protein